MGIAGYENMVLRIRLSSCSPSSHSNCQMLMKLSVNTYYSTCLPHIVPLGFLLLTMQVWCLKISELGATLIWVSEICAVKLFQKNTQKQIQFPKRCVFQLFRVPVDGLSPGDDCS
jgi:hypothetical protein